MHVILLSMDNTQIQPVVFTIIACDEMQFEKVKNYIAQFELDNRELRIEEFLVALNGDELLGFGRIREYIKSSELCSLGVVEPYRFKHIGTELSKALINKAKSELYLVCIIPPFFERLGFAAVKHFPSELADKLDFCITLLSVPEEYCVMKLQNA